MRLFSRNGVWYVSFVDSTGKRRRISTGLGNKSAAKEEAVRIIQGKPSNRVPTGLSTPTLGKALQSVYESHWSLLKSSDSMYSLVNQIIKSPISLARVDEVDTKMLRAYSEELKQEGNSGATINRKLSAIRTALLRAKSDGYLIDIPEVPRQPEMKKPERFLSQVEERAILTALDRRATEASNNHGDSPCGHVTWLKARQMQYLLIVLLDTGCRLSEVLKAERTDITESGLQVRSENSKTSKARCVPLTYRARKALLNLISLGKQLTANSAWNLWKDTVEMLYDGTWIPRGQLDDVTLHTMRHTCASRLVQAGVPLYTVSKWLGHSSIVTTERYAHLQPETLEDAKNVLEKANTYP